MKPIRVLVADDHTLLRDGDLIKIGRTIFKFIASNNIEAAYHDEIYRLTTVDGLTQVNNRRSFDETIEREISRCRRYGRTLSMVLIDIDRPSGRVQQLGAAAEARILEAMGRLLRGNTRAMDASCRLDDRLFGVLLSGVGLATAHARMEGLRRQCASQIVVLDGQELGFSVSMGVASFPHTAASQPDLMTACEAALASARARGGNHLALASIRFESP